MSLSVPFTFFIFIVLWSIFVLPVVCDVFYRSLILCHFSLLSYSVSCLSRSLVLPFLRSFWLSFCAPLFSYFVSLLALLVPLLFSYFALFLAPFVPLYSLILCRYRLFSCPFYSPILRRFWLLSCPFILLICIVFWLLSCPFILLFRVAIGRSIAGYYCLIYFLAFYRLTSPSQCAGQKGLTPGIPVFNEIRISRFMTFPW